MRKTLATLITFLVAPALGAAPASAAGAPSVGSGSTVSIPVLAYHVVTHTPSGRYQLGTTKFREQMDYLAAQGYTTLSADEYYAIMTAQSPAPAKPILLTFDDGTTDFATNVVPVLAQHGFEAVQFTVSDWVGTAGHLTAADLAALPATVDVENHTQDHEALASIGYDAALASVTTADAVLSGITGEPTQYLAYPYGRYDAPGQQAVRDAGIRMAFTVSAGTTSPGDDLLALNRNMIVSSETMSSFVKKL